MSNLYFKKVFFLHEVSGTFPIVNNFVNNYGLLDFKFFLKSA